MAAIAPPPSPPPPNPYEPNSHEPSSAVALGLKLGAAWYVQPRTSAAPLDCAATIFLPSFAWLG